MPAACPCDPCEQCLFVSDNIKQPSLQWPGGVTHADHPHPHLTGGLWPSQRHVHGGQMSGVLTRSASILPPLVNQCLSQIKEHRFPTWYFPRRDSVSRIQSMHCLHPQLGPKASAVDWQGKFNGLSVHDHVVFTGHPTPYWTTN